MSKRGWIWLGGYIGTIFAANWATEWLLQLVCCGRDDGVEVFPSWDAADSFRKSYCSGPGVLRADRPEYGGHEALGKAYHVRRRLTPSEQMLVGPVLDIRGTPEQEERWKRAQAAFPHGTLPKF